MSKRSWMKHWALLIVVLIVGTFQVHAGDIDPSGYQLLEGKQFFLLTDSVFTTEEQAAVRLEMVDKREYLAAFDGVDIVVYRVPDPIEFLKRQKNLHRPKTEGSYRGEGLSNALNYLWDVWYKKSRLAWQKIFSYDARKTVTDYAPGLKQTPPHTYHTQFENNPQFEKLPGFEFIEQFRYPIWQAQPIDKPKGVELSGSSSNFIEPKKGNLYIPIGRREPGLYLVEAIVGQYRANTLVFVSDTVAVTKISGQQLLIWTVNTISGAPSPNANILITDGVGTLQSGVTGPDGVLMLTKKNPERSYVIGEDARGGVFISENFYYDSEIYDTKMYTFTDRPLYRPGDTVHVKVMGRTFQSSKTSAPLVTGTIRMTVVDPQGTPIIVQSFNIQGIEHEQGFAAGDTSFRLPELAIGGGYAIQLVYQGKTYTSAFRVAHYTKPHYEIEIGLAKENFKTNEPITGSIRLTYPSGKPVAGARVTLNVRTQKLSMVAGELKYLKAFPLQLTEREYAASGQGLVEFELPAATDPSRYILRVLSVDQAAYRVTATKEILVEAGFLAFSISTENRFTKAGENVVFTLKRQSALPEESGQTPELHWEAIRLEDRSLISDQIAPDQSDFTISFAQAGSYTIYIKSTAGAILGSVNHWVEGAELETTPGSISIVLDKVAYQIGDIARALIVFSEPVEQALLTMERDQVELYGLLSAEAMVAAASDWISLTRESETQWKARIPITETYSPNITFSIVYVKNGQYVFQNKGIKVNIPTIDIVFTPNLQEYHPGEEVIVDVETTLHGKPVEAILTVSVVDEMIYVLQPEIAPNISEFFYHRRRNQVRTSSSLSFYTYDVAVPASGTPPNSGSYSERPLKLRERPRREEIDTALWLAALKTDTSGHARFSFTMPDSLTRWRISGRAMTVDGVVGQITAYLKSSKDFYLKWTGPNRFRQSDRPTINLVAFNLLVKPTPTDMTFFLDAFGNAHERPVTLQPGANYINIDLDALQSGYVKTGLLIDGQLYDQLETRITSLPDSWLSTKIQMIKLIEQIMPIYIPRDAYDMRVSLSQGIAEGFLKVADQLIAYPYGCVEQTSSRLIPLTLAYQYMKQFSLSPQVISRLRQLIENNRLRLVRMAGPNATFGWWGNLTGESTFMTAYAYYADWQATKALGMKVPGSHWENLLDVYNTTSANEPLLTNVIALWLANEIGLPTQTLCAGLIDKVVRIEPDSLSVDNAFHASGTSAVLTDSQMSLQDSLAIYLLHLLTADSLPSTPFKDFSTLVERAKRSLSASDSPLAQVLLLLGKSKQGLNQEETMRAQQLLAQLAAEAPTIDRALTLIFLNKAIDLTQGEMDSVTIEPGSEWEQQVTALGRPIWLFRGTDSLSLTTNIMLNKPPPKGLTAHISYESYAPDRPRLPVTIERNLYRLQQTGASTFEALPVEEEWNEVTSELYWRVDSSELYIDEITILPQSNDVLYRYGVVEIPLPSGGEVEPTTWGLKIEGLEGVRFEEGRYVMRDLIYTVPVELLNQRSTFYHLVRFSQTGIFQLPMVRYYRMYAPAEKAYENTNEPEFRKIQVR